MPLCQKTLKKKKHEEKKYDEGSSNEENVTKGKKLLETKEKLSMERLSKRKSKTKLHI